MRDEISRGEILGDSHRNRILPRSVGRQEERQYFTDWISRESSGNYLTEVLSDWPGVWQPQTKPWSTLHWQINPLHSERETSIQDSVRPAPVSVVVLDGRSHRTLQSNKNPTNRPCVAQPQQKMDDNLVVSTPDVTRLLVRSHHFTPIQNMFSSQ